MIGRREFRVVALAIDAVRACEKDPAPIVNGALDDLTDKLAREFQYLNPRFDRERFRQAAGYGRGRA